MAKNTLAPILDLIHRLAVDPRMRTDLDPELLRRFRDTRNEAAFEVIMRRHGPMVFDICRSVLGNEADAEDAFQATFLVLARKANAIEKTGTLAGWLRGVAGAAAGEESGQVCRPAPGVRRKTGA
jgi:hypothetical protein